MFLALFLTMFSARGMTKYVLVVSIFFSGIAAANPCLRPLLELRKALRVEFKESPKLQTELQNWTDILKKAYADPKKYDSVLRAVEWLSQLPLPERVAFVKHLFDSKMGNLSIALIWRTKRLTEAQDQDGFSRFVAGVSRADTPYDAIPFPRLGNSPLLAVATTARADFLGNPQATLNHIQNGGGPVKDNMKTQKHVIPGGVHTIEEFQKLMWRRMEDMMQADPKTRRSIDEALEDISKRDPTESPFKEKVEFLRELGFDTTPEVLLTIGFLGGDRWGMGRQHNGVVRLWNDRFMFTTKGWDNTALAAEFGLAPAGAKTLFPRSWTEQTIHDAIAHVLSNPNSRIISEATKGSWTRSLIEGQYQGVYVVVGINNGKVATAFPTWRQQKPLTVKSAHYAWSMAYDRLRELTIRINEKRLASRNITADEVVQIYLGKKINLPDTEQEKLLSWLNPEKSSEDYLKNAHDPFLSRDVFTKKTDQTLVFEFLEMERIVKDIENVRWGS